MAQARTLSPTEMAQVLAYTDTRSHAARDRAMLLLTHWAGLRGVKWLVCAGAMWWQMARSKTRSACCPT
jgi:site-specific recombinase XerC